MAPRGRQFTERVEPIERRTQVIALRSQNLTFQQIGDALGLHKTTAKRDYDAAMADARERSADAAIAYREQELAVLLAVRNELLKVLYGRHIYVADGHVVRDPDGELILDTGPKIAAARELRQNSESIRKLLGLDAPTRSEISGTAALEVTVVDEFTRRLDALAVQLAAGPTEAARVAGTSTIEAGHAGR